MTRLPSIARAFSALHQRDGCARDGLCQSHHRTLHGIGGKRVVELCRKGFGGKLSLPTNERHADGRNSRMNIRRAVQSDVSRIMQIRHLVRENRLSDPNLVTAKDCAEFIDRSEMWVWEDEGVVQALASARAVFALSTLGPVPTSLPTSMPLFSF
jgi:hypothetical protein